jgi:hypothetical protein
MMQTAGSQKKVSDSSGWHDSLTRPSSQARENRYVVMLPGNRVFTAQTIPELDNESQNVVALGQLWSRVHRCYLTCAEHVLMSCTETPRLC